MGVHEVGGENIPILPQVGRWIQLAGILARVPAAKQRYLSLLLRSLQENLLHSAG
jgi:hypothetical protein